MSLFKIVVLTGLIILGLVIDLGGAPGHDRIGFRYWKESPFSHYLVSGNTGVFLGVWAVMVNALFAYSECSALPMNLDVELGARFPFPSFSSKNPPS